MNVPTIIKRLKNRYGNPPVFKRSPPIDELVKTVLSQNTTDLNSLKAFDVLKSHFKSWDSLLRADAGQIAGLIRHAGLANIKANRIKGILAEIKRREGRLDLSFLAKMKLEESLDYLKSLKGVGPKTAACVMLFSFGRPAMPVDTHIFRVTRRLGIINESIGIEEAHRVLSGIVPKHLIYDFHLGIIEHGRRTCKAQNPGCGACVLYSLCKFKLKATFKKRGRK